MENTLPFEYGYLYKPIVITDETDINEKDKNDLHDLKWTSNTTTCSYSNWGRPKLTVINTDIGEYFNPIGYNPKTQKVVLEIFKGEQEVFENLVSFTNNQFDSGNIIEKNYKKVDRIEVDVNLFIKYFEKVL